MVPDLLAQPVGDPHGQLDDLRRLQALHRVQLDRVLLGDPAG